MKKEHPFERKKKPPVMKQEKNKKIDERSDEPRQRRMKHSLSRYKYSGLYQSSNHRRPSIFKKSDENVQNKWKSYGKHSKSLLHDEKSQDERKNNQKQRSPGYIKLNLQRKLNNDEPQVENATKKHTEHDTEVDEIKEKEINDEYATPPQEDSDEATGRGENSDIEKINGKSNKPPEKDGDNERSAEEREDSNKKK